MSELGILQANERSSASPDVRRHHRVGNGNGALWATSALAFSAAHRMADTETFMTQGEALRQKVVVALNWGDVGEARRLMDALPAEHSAAEADEWTQLRDMTAWPDAWLVAAVRREPPDEAALNVLADRYWKPLFARCQMLTLNREKASDLAQQAWCRVLRARHSLKTDGNFPAYLSTVATNLWRDAHRAALRAGPMAETRLVSLDQALPAHNDDSVMLGEVLPDLNSLDAEEQRNLAIDLDEALARLTPLLRDILVARFVTGESCAEIGRRYSRTEQTVSAWVRQAIREIRICLEDPDQRHTL